MSSFGSIEKNIELSHIYLAVPGCKVANFINSQIDFKLIMIRKVIKKNVQIIIARNKSFFSPQKSIIKFTKISCMFYNIIRLECY